MAQADIPTVAPGAHVLAGVAEVPLRIRGFDYRRAAFGDAWTDDNPAPGGHNGCDTRNDTSDRDLSTRHMCRSREPQRRCHRHPARSVHQRHRGFRAWQSGRRVRSDRPHRAAGAGLDPGPEPGPTTCACGSPTIPPICSRWPDKPTRTRAIPSRCSGCHPTSRSAANMPCSSWRCCGATGYPSTRHGGGPARGRVDLSDGVTSSQVGCAMFPVEQRQKSRDTPPPFSGDFPSARRGLGAHVGVGVRTEPRSVVEAVDRRHLVAGQLEVEHVEVFLDALR